MPLGDFEKTLKLAGISRQDIRRALGCNDSRVDRILKMPLTTLTVSELVDLSHISGVDRADLLDTISLEKTVPIMSDDDFNIYRGRWRSGDGFYQAKERARILKEITIDYKIDIIKLLHHMIVFTPVPELVYIYRGRDKFREVNKLRNRLKKRAMSKHMKRVPWVSYSKKRKFYNDNKMDSRYYEQMYYDLKRKYMKILSSPEIR